MYSYYITIFFYKKKTIPPGYATVSNAPYMICIHFSGSKIEKRVSDFCDYIAHLQHPMSCRMRFIYNCFDFRAYQDSSRVKITVYHKCLVFEYRDVVNMSARCTAGRSTASGTAIAAGQTTVFVHILL